jgi:ABC-2 type transport system ATP-binding protein
VVQDELSSLRVPTGQVVLTTPAPAEVVALLDGRVSSVDGDTLTVRHDDPGALNAQLVGAGLSVTGLSVERRTLEQVVLEATTTSSDRVEAA